MKPIIETNLFNSAVSLCVPQTLSGQKKRLRNKKAKGRDDAQRLQTLNPHARRERARDERDERAARLAEARDPADAAGEQPRREHARGVVHDDRVDGPEEHADEGDGDAAADERGDEPDH